MDFAWIDCFFRKYGFCLKTFAYLCFCSLLKTDISYLLIFFAIHVLLFANLF